MSYVITEACIGTKARNCVEVCPVDCIYDAGDQYLINPEEMKAYITKAARFDFSGIEPGKRRRRCRTCHA